MSKVAIVYWSGTDNTTGMAKILDEAVKKNGAEAELIYATDFSSAKAAGFDAFAFGCPAMGAEVLEEDEFEPMFTEVEGLLSGKKVGLFGSYGWGDGEWMRNWEERVKNDGANLVCDGVMACGEADADTESALDAMAKALV